MAEVIEINREHTFTLPLKGDEDIAYLTLTIDSPHGASVRCKVNSGAGEFSLYKNGRFVGNTHILIAEPGYPATIEFRTLTKNEEYGLNNETIDTNDIPDDLWELYVAALDRPKQKAKLNFSVKVIPWK